MNSKNLFKAINIFVKPLLTYSIEVIKWSQTDLENRIISTEPKLTKSNKQHSHACKQSVTLPRKNGLHNNQIAKPEHTATDNHTHHYIIQTDKETFTNETETKTKHRGYHKSVETKINPLQASIHL